MLAGPLSGAHLIVPTFDRKVQGLLGYLNLQGVLSLFTAEAMIKTTNSEASSMQLLNRDYASNILQIYSSYTSLTTSAACRPGCR